MMTIKDGSGRGYTAGVDSRNNLQVFATKERHEAVDANLQGLYYAAYVSNTPGGAGNNFIYLGNTSKASFPSTFHVVSADFYGASAEALEFYLGATGTIASGTAATLASMNGNTSLSPTIDFQTGTAMTGVDSAASLVGHIGLSANKVVVPWRPDGRIIVPPGKAVFMKAVAGSVAVRGFIYIMYPNPDIIVSRA